MDIKVNELKDQLMREYVVTADPKGWADEQQKVKSQIAKTIEIKGFRKGQAPEELVNARIQDSLLIKEAIKMYGPKMVDEAIKKDNDIMKTTPQVEIVKQTTKELVLKFKFFKKPEITLPKWADLKAETGATEAKKEEVELEVKALLNRFAKKVEKKDAAKKADIVTLDFKGFVGKEAFQGGEAKDHALELGSNTFIPGFEDQLVGVKAGDKKDVVVTFPKDYPSKQLAGNEATFKCEIKKVEMKELPELNDEFVKGLNVAFLQSKADLEKNIKAHIKQAKDSQLRRKNEENIVKLIAEKAKVALPPIWVEQETKKLRAEFEQKLAMQGMTIADYSKKTNNDEKKILSELAKDAETRLTTQFVLADVREQAKISVSAQQAKEELEKVAKAMQKPFEEVEKQVGGLQVFRGNLETKKVFEYITGKLGK